MPTLTRILLSIDAIVLGSLLLLILFIRYFAYSFLAVSQVNEAAELLVVEGWLDTNALQAAIAEFNRGQYHFIVTVGGPLNLRISTFAPYQNFGELSADILIQLGVDAGKVIPLASPNVLRDNTTTMAIALRDWLQNDSQRATGQAITGITLFSGHIHARRSWMTYRRYLPDDITVGILASDAIAYDSQGWWKTTRGFKAVLMELISYCYIVVRFGVAPADARIE